MFFPHFRRSQFFSDIGHVELPVRERKNHMFGESCMHMYPLRVYEAHSGSKMAQNNIFKEISCNLSSRYYMTSSYIMG